MLQENMITRLAVSIQCRNVTDRWTDRQTDGHNCYINIARQHCCALQMCKKTIA